jgi:hypothetical protein
MQLLIKITRHGMWKVVTDGDYISMVTHEDKTQVEKLEDSLFLSMCSA